MGVLRVVSYSDEPFEDRKAAGRLLAEALNEFRGKDAVVLGIPRGGMVVAGEIALLLDARLDIALSRKLGAPGNPELAIGAVGESGRLFLNQGLTLRALADKKYIEAEKARQLSELKGRVRLFRRVKEKAALKGRTVILTDDGVATGATMRAALWDARQDGPDKLIAAIPVGAKDSLEALVEYTDELVALRVPGCLVAVGQFYLNFGQTTDEEVLEILKSR